MPKIAPHINNEVRLVLSGSKPLGVIEHGKDNIGFSMAVAMASTGAIASLVADSEIVFTLPSNRRLILEYRCLIIFGVKQFGIKEYHRRMGKLFGYTEADIEAFIFANIDCNCTKCRGIQK